MAGPPSYAYAQHVPKTPNQHQNVNVCTIVCETQLLLQMSENDLKTAIL